MNALTDFQETLTRGAAHNAYVATVIQMMDEGGKFVRQDDNPLGEKVWISRDDELCLTLSAKPEMYWALGSFTDSDVDGIAVGRYRTFAEGSELSELEAAIKGAMRCAVCGCHTTDACEHCGDPSCFSHARSWEDRDDSVGYASQEHGCVACMPKGRP